MDTQTKHIDLGREQAVEIVRQARQAPVVRAAGLLGRLRFQRRELAALYRRLNKESTSQAGQWLCDNFYLLERESRQSTKELARWKRYRRQGELGRIIALCSQAFLEGEVELTDANLLALVRAAGEVAPFTVGQLDFLALGLRAALLALCHRAMTATPDRELAADRMRRGVEGLAHVSSLDLEELVTLVSPVEGLLREDPAGVYPRMTEESRRAYRAAVAQVALGENREEEAVAREALEAARAGQTPRDRHVGRPLLDWYRAACHTRRRGTWALLTQALLPLAVGLWLWWLTGSLWTLVLGYLPLWEALRPFVERAALTGLRPDILPSMELGEDCPRAAVVISTLLPSSEGCPALQKRLEQLYVANRGENLCYCVLADFKEAPYPEMPEDASRTKAAVAVIDGLNREYGSHFVLVLRRRAYCQTQRRYCGWERKRGAILQLAAYMREGTQDFLALAGDGELLRKSRYLLALDADTNLAFGSARRMLETAAHPLNQPVIDRERGVVVAGYGIFAPKMGVELQSAKATAFAQVMAGSGGVTAYETADRDFYQDLFGEGIFAGKGLVDVDCFYTLLKDRLPENQVLSHDILEGAFLRTAFLSGVEMTDATPGSLFSWMARAHRWMRGDWQNVFFLGKTYQGAHGKEENPISPLSRWKLWDNLRRASTPVACLLAVVAACFLPHGAALALWWAVVLSVLAGPLTGAVSGILSGGFFSISRKYFVGAMPQVFEALARGGFGFILLAHTAFVNLDAAVRAMGRSFVSRKGMLEWTTAAQGETGAIGWGKALARTWPATALGAALLFSPAIFTRFTGVLFLLTAPLGVLTAKPRPVRTPAPSPQERERLLSYCAAMWRYFEDYAGPDNHYLPPDNVQQSPVYRVARRTSPTNIGLLLLACLTARDCLFIDTAGLCRRVARTLDTVERLPMWHGNLYNWYDTATLELLHPAFVSTVDSGNFVGCLVALKEGLRELWREDPAVPGLVARIERLIGATDLSPLYDRRRRLFSIGYDTETGRLSGSHYDFLMSEARLTSYFAVATGQAGRRHWGAFSRTLSRCGSYAGPVSWTGTMFEFFMPHLLLPAPEGSLLDEALRFCIYCQRRRVGDKRPWGISESGYYAFDDQLNYQYKAHGVQWLGVKRGLDQELVVSPYSTFLTAAYCPRAAMENLARLEEMGVFGQYGFYEAVDFTPGRAGPGGEVVRSYMAHHLGMSMTAAANALFDGVIQRRFMRDYRMKAAEEFLQERIDRNSVVYSHLGGAGDDRRHRPDVISQALADPTPTLPRAAMLAGGGLCYVTTDVGGGFLRYGGVDITRRPTDLLRSPQGLFAFVRWGGRTVSATAAPLYHREVTYRAEFATTGVEHHATSREMELWLRAILHPVLPCLQVDLAIHSHEQKSISAQALFYLEPVLATFQDYDAHPAFSKLFVTGTWDRQTQTLVFRRRSRSGQAGVCLAVGWRDGSPLSFTMDRSRLLSAPGGFGTLEGLDVLPLDQTTATPDVACAVGRRLSLAAGGQARLTLVLAAGASPAEAIDNLVTMRRADPLDSKSGACSPFISDRMEGRLCLGSLGQVLFPGPGSPSRQRRLAHNKAGQSALWALGVSGDLPIVAARPSPELGDQRLVGLMRLGAMLRPLGLEYDLAVLCQSQGDLDHARELAGQADCTQLLGLRGGVHLLLESAYSRPSLDALLAAACLLAGEPAPEARPYRPARLERVRPAPLPLATPGALRVTGGLCLDSGFVVEKTSPLPWAHPLCSPQFGTLVTDRTLGFTWRGNSRENRLTPWDNDIGSGGAGEQLVLRVDGGLVDAIDGSRATFYGDRAAYRGGYGGLELEVVVTVAPLGCAKLVDLTVENPGDRPRSLECAYYLEPVLGVTPQMGVFAQLLFEEGRIQMENPWNTAFPGGAQLSADRPGARPLFDRAAFWEGRWEASGDYSIPPAAALILPLELPPGRREKIRFILSAGRTADAAAQVAACLPAGARPGARLELTSPDPALDRFINVFAPRQALEGRLWGRSGFYQSGGAYGFRDQLQDACGLVLLDPELLRIQIFRCCAVQFEEGDVLHWWHNLPKGGGGLRGVRTRYSDDLLWLPYAAARYWRTTGRGEFLSAKIAYLAAPELPPEEMEQYLAPGNSPVREDVYGHCIRALERGLRLGDKGLPLIGGGDWNDGFNKVGAGGKGQSVWLAMFLVMVLEDFAPLCDLRGDLARGEDLRRRAACLREAVDRHCWDGQWYLRAFYDDGSPMGAAGSDECAIDLLPQAFAALCAMPGRERVEKALDSALDRLWDRDNALVRLFDPPFAAGAQKPGYVKAYPAGIRENGGQYTHAAVWFAMGLLRAGRVDQGAEILEMLNPLWRASQRRLADKTLTEPYYLAADIYAGANKGRGGWSIYTGAAAWYWRVVWEELLGVRPVGGGLELHPVLPAGWEGFSAQVDFGAIRLTLRVVRGGTPTALPVVVPPGTGELAVEIRV